MVPFFLPIVGTSQRNNEKQKDRDSVLQSLYSWAYKKHLSSYVVQPPPEKEETGQKIDPSLQRQWKQKLFHNFYVSWA